MDKICRVKGVGTCAASAMPASVLKRSLRRSGRCGAMLAVFLPASQVSFDPVSGAAVVDEVLDDVLPLGVAEGGLEALDLGRRCLPRLVESEASEAEWIDLVADVVDVGLKCSPVVSKGRGRREKSAWAGKAWMVERSLIHKASEPDGLAVSSSDVHVTLEDELVGVGVRCCGHL